LAIGKNDPGNLLLAAARNAEREWPLSFCFVTHGLRRGKRIKPATIYGHFDPHLLTLYLA
jgi:hypothetical protein